MAASTLEKRISRIEKAARSGGWLLFKALMADG